MSELESFHPGKILVIDFGQLGDVVLSLPALREIRHRFPNSHITVSVGQSAADIVRLAGYADEIIGVDRVGLRDGPKLVSIMRLFKLLQRVRRERFDFVIDLHSLSETNVLGFLSGAPKRLFSRRPPRSLDFLANFEPRPPVARDHRERHLIDRYLDVLQPLGIKTSEREPRIITTSSDAAAVDRILRKAGADSGFPLVGLFPGAGNPSRMWPAAKFAQLADYLIRNDGVRVLLFLGPEEASMQKRLKETFPPGTIFMGRLTLPQLAAAQARLAAFVSNDTGPMHIAAAVGTPVVVLIHNTTPKSYLPLGDRHRFVSSAVIDEISVEQAYEATRGILASSRLSTLFTR